jgi:hypothetical protein
MCFPAHLRQTIFPQGVHVASAGIRRFVGAPIAAYLSLIFARTSRSEKPHSEQTNPLGFIIALPSGASSAGDPRLRGARGRPRKGRSLLPVLEFFRGYFGITEQDTARTARDKIAGRMVLLDEKLAEGLPVMFDFLGVPDPERPAPPLDPEARQRRFFDVIRRLARARSAREPSVLLFEDLHWFDRASEEFIENLVVENAPGNRTRHSACVAGE